MLFRNKHVLKPILIYYQLNDTVLLRQFILLWTEPCQPLNLHWEQWQESNLHVLINWCHLRDSNPKGRSRRILSALSLPISPRWQFWRKRQVSNLGRFLSLVGVQSRCIHPLYHVSIIAAFKFSKSNVSTQLTYYIIHNFIFYVYVFF